MALQTKTYTAAGGYNDHYHLCINVVENSVDQTANTSEVTIKMYAYSDDSSYGAYGGTASYTINYYGKTVTGSVTADFRNKATVTFKTITATIAHASDGTGYFSVNGKFTYSGSSYLSGISISTQKFVLTTIPRAATLTLGSTSISLDNSIKLTYGNTVSTYKYYVTCACGSKTVNVVGSSSDMKTASQLSSSYTVTLAVWGPALPSATSGTATFTLYTYSGSTKIGSSTAKCTFNIPATVTPSVTSIVLEPSNPTDVTTDYYIQNVGAISVSSIVAAGASGSTITTYAVNVNGEGYGSEKTYSTSATYTTGKVYQYGDVSITIRVTDSRGRTGILTKTVTFYRYVNPTVDGIYVQRCDATGKTGSGSDYKYFRYDISTSFASIHKANTANATITCDVLSGFSVTYSLTDPTEDDTIDEIIKTTTSATVTSFTLEENVAAVFTVTITDTIGNTNSKTYKLSTGKRLVTYLVSKMSWAFGKFINSDYTDTIENDLTLRQNKEVIIDGDNADDRKVHWVGDNSDVGFITETGESGYLRLKFKDFDETKEKELFTYDVGTNVLNITGDVTVGSLPLLEADVTVTANSTNTSDMHACTCKYYAALGLVTFYARFTTKVAMSAGTAYPLASMSTDYRPRVSLPMNAFTAATSHKYFPVQCRLVYDSMAVSVVPSYAIASGSYIYVSGTWHLM